MRFSGEPFVRTYMPGSKRFVHPGIERRYEAKGTWGKVGSKLTTGVKHYLSGANVNASGVPSYKFKIPRASKVTREMARRLPVGGSMPRVVQVERGDIDLGDNDGGDDAPRPGNPLPPQLPPSMAPPIDQESKAARRAPMGLIGEYAPHAIPTTATSRLYPTVYGSEGSESGFVTPRELESVPESETMHPLQVGNGPQTTLQAPPLTVQT